MQLFFQSISKNGKNLGVGMCLDGVLPEHRDIDCMLRLLKEFKKKNTNVEILKHNEKVWSSLDNHISVPGKKTERTQRTGYIYIIKCQEFHKIGKTIDMMKRYDSYLAENPFETTIIYKKKVNDYTTCELELHKMFRDKKHKSEWFKLDDDDLTRIKTYLKNKGAK